MEERIVKNDRPRRCDLCGQTIQFGELHRISKPEYGGIFWYHEHLRCPSAPAVVTGSRPKHPLIKQEHALVGV